MFDLRLMLFACVVLAWVCWRVYRRRRSSGSPQNVERLKGREVAVNAFALLVSLGLMVVGVALLATCNARN